MSAARGIFPIFGLLMLPLAGSGPAAAAEGTTLVSVASDGARSNATSSGPAVSAAGELVAFPSLATNLVAGDGNALPDVFLAEQAH
jgi:hypothetical protein